MLVKKSIWLLVAILLLLIPCIYFSISAYLKRGVNAVVVRSAYILENSNIMKKANEEFSRDATRLKSNLDTLKSRSYKFGQILALKPNDITAKRMYKLATEDYNVFLANAEKELQARKDELTSKSLSKINEYIADYAKSKGIDVVLGTTNNGSVLYCEPSVDVTNEVFEYIQSKKVN